MGRFFTYILYSDTLDRFYIGYTEDLDKRLLEHRSGDSRFTSRADDWRYVYYQGFSTRSEANRLERSIKRSKSRKSLMRYIHSETNALMTFGSVPTPASRRGRDSGR